MVSENHLSSRFDASDSRDCEPTQNSSMLRLVQELDGAIAAAISAEVQIINCAILICDLLSHIRSITSDSRFVIFSRTLKST